MTWQSGKEKPKQSESEKEKQVKLDAALTSTVGRGLEKLRKIEKNGGVAWHYTLVIIPGNIFIAIVNRGHKAAENPDTYNRFPFVPMRGDTNWKYDKKIRFSSK